MSSGQIRLYLNAGGSLGEQRVQGQHSRWWLGGDSGGKGKVCKLRFVTCFQYLLKKKKCPRLGFSPENRPDRGMGLSTIRGWPTSWESHQVSLVVWWSWTFRGYSALEGTSGLFESRAIPSSELNDILPYKARFHSA